MSICPLCYTKANLFYENKKRRFSLCPQCKGIFLDQEFLPDKESEIARYKEHNNDTNNPGYQLFVSPIVNAVLRDFKPAHHGLDFGAGPGPVISKMLTDKNYDIKQYDPFFKNDRQLLEKKYDYIVCCEVIEHFHHPKKEFELLQSLLNENGKLYCMTNIYNPAIDFNSWYYKNDRTHVFFYQEETLHFVQKTLRLFSKLIIEENLIIFSK